MKLSLHSVKLRLHSVTRFLVGPAALLGVSLTAAAANFDGTIVISRNETFVTLSNFGMTFPLVTTDPEIKNQIKKLAANDFISLEGDLDSVRRVIVARSVNYVGLKELLGRWVGDDEFCYKFATFSSLVIYHKTDEDRCDFAPPSRARDFAYTINSGFASWTVLLSDDQSSFLIDLSFRSKNFVELSLYDSRSGDILKTIKLRR